MDKAYLTPIELVGEVVEIGIKKVKIKPINQIILGILAGAFIAFASEGSNMAAFNLFAKPETYGIGKALAGVVFATGLMLVIIAGGELFTGNMLIIIGVLEKKIKIKGMLSNWFFVYLGNLLGGILIAYMMFESGLFNSGDNMLGGVTLRIASYKTGIEFSQAFFLGIMCNWIVCLAVWMSYAAKDIVGKCFAIFFPISLFITSGFEHSVANMYYIPAGILAKANPAWVSASGLSAEKLAQLNWGSFAINNLVPVTIGNIVGGGLLVAIVYWFVFYKNNK